MDDKNCSLIGHFEGIEDPRVNRMKLHKLIDIIVIALCAMNAKYLNTVPFSFVLASAVFLPLASDFSKH